MFYFRVSNLCDKLRVTALCDLRVMVKTTKRKEEKKRVTIYTI